jgi:hypothetical protein
LIALTELLIEFPGNEVEVFAGMKGYFSHEYCIYRVKALMSR